MKICSKNNGIISTKVQYLDRQSPYLLVLAFSTVVKRHRVSFVIIKASRRNNKNLKINMPVFGPMASCYYEYRKEVAPKRVEECCNEEQNTAVSRHGIDYRVVFRRVPPKKLLFCGILNYNSYKMYI